MQSGVEERSSVEFEGRGFERLRVLAVCLEGGDSLGSSLEAVLKSAQNVHFVREDLCDRELESTRIKLARQFAKVRPMLLLLCLPSGALSKAEVIFEAARQNHWDVPILVILEAGAPDELHRLLSLGAADFILMPLKSEDLLPRLFRWHRAVSLGNDVVQSLNEKLGLDKFIGRSRPFVEAIQKIPKFAKCDASVFIAGETGTGKEMCARAIHHLGHRADHAFVPVNCGAIPSELVENELFGHEAGAFTGASSTVRGLVHEAEGGTLFLDEIDSLPLQTQVKFLRFLQDQEYRPLGAGRTCKADIRVIAASNADLETAARYGRFRSDLFYRLNILPLNLPPLRDRREDIPLLAGHFLAKSAGESSTSIKELSRSALDKLLAHQWPGNVRELQNVIERAVVLSELPLIVVNDICLPENGPSPEDTSFKTLKARAIKEFETAFVRQMLIDNDGNISKAARAAKKNRRAFWQLMRKHRIAVPTSRQADQTDWTNAC